MDPISFFAEPLQYAFIQRGMLALILVGGISAVVGCFVVVRGMSFFGDALAHSILPGVAISYTISGGYVATNLFFGGLGAGIVSALVIALADAQGRSQGRQRHRHCLCELLRARHRHCEHPGQLRG